MLDEHPITDDYIVILDRLKTGLDSLKSEMFAEFAHVRTDFDRHLKKHFLASLEIIRKLTIAAEMKDEATASHIKRIGLYCKLIASELGMDDDFIERIYYASPLHDIGKIGIPDKILLKEGRLTTQEFEIAKTHTVLGHEILKESEFPVIQLSAVISLTHHEKWDGSGYPKGLMETEIPLAGRITLLADQYDSLRSLRPYKKEITHLDACNKIMVGDDITKPQYIDPKLLEIFKKHHAKFEKIYNENV